MKNGQDAAADFFQQLEWVSIEKVNWLDDEAKQEQGVRLYCTAANTTWSLQVRAPLKLANGGLGKDYIVATASLPRAALLKLRAVIDKQIERQDGKHGRPRRKATR